MPVLGQVQLQVLGGVVGAVGVDAAVDRVGEDEGLERRSRLAVPLGGEVVLAGLVGAAGGHREDVAVGRVDRDHRGRRVGRVGKLAGDRLPSGRLEVRVEGGVDLQPALADRVDAVVGDQLVLDVVEEVGLADAAVGVGAVQLQRPLVALDSPVLRDVAELGHLLNHLVAALLRTDRVEQRVVLGRRLRKAGEQRRLLERQLPDRLREVGLCRRLHADRGAALDRSV